MHREEAVERTVKHLGELRSSEGETGHHWRSVGCTIEALGEWYHILESTGRASRTYQKKLGWTERQDGLGITEAVIGHNRVLGWTGSVVAGGICKHCCELKVVGHTGQQQGILGWDFTGSHCGAARHSRKH